MLTAVKLPCYGPNYTQHEDVIDFFETAIQYYQRFPTYAWLQQAGITPSNTTQVTLSDVQGALTKASTAIPYVGCTGPKYNETTAGQGSSDNGRTVIDELWYYMYVYGRPQDGVAVHVNASGSSSSCATTKNALWYYQPTNSSLQS